MKSEALRNTLVDCSLLFLAVGLLYGKSIGFDFISTWDDGRYVLDNPLIRTLTLTNLKEIFTRPYHSNFAPLHTLSYAMDYALWGLDPRGYHLINITLHGLNASLAYAVVKRITGRRLVAWLSALLFAVHPVNVENVAWISERKTLMATFFMFLALLSYQQFRGGSPLYFYVVSIVLFSCALLSKASAVPLPLILVSYEFIFCRTEGKWLHLVPFFALAVVASLVAYWSQVAGHSIDRSIMTLDMLWGTVYPTMIPIFWKYVGMLIWPVNLSGYYDTDLYNSFLAPAVLLSLGAWVIVFLFVFLKGNRQVRFWFLWFWLFLLPVSNIVPLPVYYADRYMYAPCISFCVLVGLAVAGIPESMKGANMGAFTASWRKTAPVVVTFVPILLLYSFLTFSRLDVWRNEVLFWEDARKKSPNLYVVHLNLGLSYEKGGRLAEAEEEYLRAIAIFPAEGAIENLKILRAKMQLQKRM